MSEFARSWFPQRIRGFALCQNRSLQHVVLYDSGASKKRMSDNVADVFGVGKAPSHYKHFSHTASSVSAALDVAHCSTGHAHLIPITVTKFGGEMSQELEETNESSVKLQSYITESGLPVGPQPGVEYPLTVVYCGNCGLPTEYCEYYAENEKCKSWFEANLPEEFAKQTRIGNEAKEGEGSKETEDDKKRQKRGGKGLAKPKKKEGGPKKICLSVAPRGRKRLTCVVGLKSYDIDLKVAAKFFGTKFACGTSVTGEDEIVIQGDVKDDLFDLLPEKWPQIDEDSIEDLGEVKR